MTALRVQTGAWHQSSPASSQEALTQTFTQTTNRSEYKACTVHWHKPLAQTIWVQSMHCALTQTLITNYQQTPVLSCTVKTPSHKLPTKFGYTACTDTNPSHKNPSHKNPSHKNPSHKLPTWLPILHCALTQTLQTSKNTSQYTACSVYRHNTNNQQVWVHNLKCVLTQTSHTNYQQTWVHSCTGTNTTHKLLATIPFGTELHTHYRQQ